MPALASFDNPLEVVDIVYHFVRLQTACRWHGRCGCFAGTFW